MICDVDPRRFWNYIRNMKGLAGVHNTVHHQCVIASDPLEIVNLFADYFSSVYTRSTCAVPEFSYEHKVNLDTCKIDLVDVFYVLDKIKIRGSEGPDGLPALLLYNCRFV